MIWRVSLLLLICGGCAAKHVSVVDAFPPAGMASPWILHDQVWTGTFEEAAPALGDEAEDWRVFQPTHAWLTKYCHQRVSRRCLTVRCFAFASAEDARRAYDSFRPDELNPFEAGDAGCWTEIGILFHWGRLVCEVFGDDNSWDSQIQSGLLAAFITERMPAGAPQQPK